MLAVCVSSLSQKHGDIDQVCRRRVPPDLGIDAGEIDPPNNPSARNQPTRPIESVLAPSRATRPAAPSIETRRFVEVIQKSKAVASRA